MGKVIPISAYLVLKPVAKPHKHFLSTSMAIPRFKKAMNILI